jgi:hypothetical protein
MPKFALDRLEELLEFIPITVRAELMRIFIALPPSGMEARGITKEAILFQELDPPE